MAKHIRETANVYGSYWSDWVEWANSNGYDVHATREESIKAEAVKSGRSPEDVSKERYEVYYAMRKEFEAELKALQSDKEQTLLVRNNSLDSACSVYQRADRILTGLPVEVYLNDDPEQSAPAWNDGKNITFNAKTIKAINDETVRSLHGLNYHEVAHLLFTPRVGTALGKWVVETKIATHTQVWTDYEGNTHSSEYSTEQLVNPARSQAFNILEDCRAETYLVRKYPSVRPFLTALIGEYLIETPEQTAENFILLAGRRYFPIEARRVSALLYARAYGEEQAKLVYSICSEYRSLVFPRDYTRAMELIEQLVAIMPADLETPSGCGGRKPMRNGRPASEKEQDSLIKDEADENLMGGAGWADIDKDTDTDTGKVNDETAHFAEPTEELEKLVKTAVENAKADETLRKKVAETSKAIVKNNSTKSLLGKSNGTNYEPTQSEVVASRLFGQELERIRIDCDPAWELERPTGKLNVRRAMNADVNDIGKLFDRWETGNDDYDIESCILLDRSGSMWNQMGAVCRSSWVIKRGIEKINGRVSVMTFNQNSRTLYSAEEKALANAVKLVESSGGTDPYYALLETERIMTQSKAHTKLVFLLTDGGFSPESDKIITRLKNAGAYVSLVFLGDERQLKWLTEGNLEEYKHGANDFRAITKPNDLVMVAKDVVRHNTKKAGR